MCVRRMMLLFNAMLYMLVRYVRPRGPICFGACRHSCSSSLAGDGPNTCRPYLFGHIIPSPFSRSISKSTFDISSPRVSCVPSGDRGLNKI